MRIVPLLIATLALWGCASPKPTVSPPGELARESLTRTGVLFGSIGIAEDGVRYPEIVWRRKGSRETGTIRAGLPGQTASTTLRGDDGVTVLPYSIRLPAGDYEIVGWSAVEHYEQNGMLTIAHWTADQKFVVPFSVADNRATYMGELVPYANPVRFRKLFWVIGTTEKTGVHFVVTDRLDRDRAAVDPAGSVLPPPDRIDKALATLIAKGTPIFRGAQAATAPVSGRK